MPLWPALLLAACSGQPHDSATDSAPDDTAAPEGARSLSEAPVVVSGPPSSAAGTAVAFGPSGSDGAATVVISAPFAGSTCAWTRRMSGPHTFDDADACWTGEGTRDYAGAAVHMGDVTGDGEADLLVGAIANGDIGPNAGKAYVVPGPLAGGSLTDAIGLFGETKGDYAGWTVAALGDVDGDGTGDLAVGAPSNERGGSGAGAVYLLRGPVTATTGLAAADGIVIGTGPAVADADAWAPPPHGAPAEGDGVGSVMDAVGDVNGDGLADLLLGANGHDGGGSNAGATVVIFGPVANGVVRFDDADRVWIGGAPEVYMGDAVAGAGDLDGDGLADLVTTEQGDTPGVVWVLPGLAPSGLVADAAIEQLVGEVLADQAGAAVSAAGDVDGDGWRDVVVGAYGRDLEGVVAGDDAGAAYVVRGPFTGGTRALRDADAVWLGLAGGDNAGRAVAGGADHDGDGRPDVLVGALYADIGGAFSGAAYLVPGWEAR